MYPYKTGVPTAFRRVELRSDCSDETLYDKLYNTLETQIRLSRNNVVRYTEIGIFFKEQYLINNEHDEMYRRLENDYNSIEQTLKERDPDYLTKEEWDKSRNYRYDVYEIFRMYNDRNNNFERLGNIHTLFSATMKYNDNPDKVMDDVMQAFNNLPPLE